MGDRRSENFFLGRRRTASSDAMVAFVVGCCMLHSALAGGRLKLKIDM